MVINSVKESETEKGIAHSYVENLHNVDSITILHAEGSKNLRIVNHRGSEVLLKLIQGDMDSLDEIVTLDSSIQGFLVIAYNMPDNARHLIEGKIVYHPIRERSIDYDGPTQGSTDFGSAQDILRIYENYLNVGESRSNHEDCRLKPQR